MKLFPFQEEAVTKMLHFLNNNPTNSCYNACEMGCVSGSATIKINRGGSCKTYTIEELYTRFNTTWRKDIVSNTRSWTGGEAIRLNEIKKVLYMGEKEVLTLTTETKKLTLTPDHEVLTTEGWIRADNLTSQSVVATDSVKPVPRKTIKIKSRYNTRQVPMNYPAGYLRMVHGNLRKVREVHILVMEASLNGVSFYDYLYEVLPKPTTYTTIDSSRYHVHHIDGNCKNNLLSNLQLLEAKAHNRLHGRYEHFNQGVIWENVKSITPSGIDKVYDLVMDDPHRNFVANGIVVHNCGKSAMTCSCMEALAINKFIIIAPAVMRLTWLNELRTWYPHAVSQCCSVITKVSDIGRTPKNNSIIISYDLAATEEFIEFVKATDGLYEMLVTDEAHYLKSKKAKRTKAILGEIWPKCKYKIALSGTPFTQSVIDGYTMFNKMLPSKFPNFTQFAYKYSYVKPTPWGPKYFGVKNSEELSSVIRNNFYIRYRKEEVLKDLPPKIFQKVVLPEKYSVTADADTQKAVVKAMQELDEGKVPYINGSLATLKRAQGLAKVPAIVEYTKEILDQDIPVVLFAYHRDVITQLAEELSKYKPVIITGDTSGTARQKAVTDFQAGETKLFIGNITAAGVGITLTASSNVVLGELTWSPAEISQAVDRCHRISQKDTVNVHYFVTQNSIDEGLVDTIMNKSQTFRKVID